MNRDTYTTAMSIIDDRGESALSETLQLAEAMKTFGRLDQQKRWKDIAEAIRDIHGQQTAAKQ